MDDFLIIGGGIAGVSAGARLAKLGRVQLIEAEEALAYHASGRSAALFEMSLGSPAVIQLNLASHAYHQSENGGVLSPRGFMVVGKIGHESQFEHDLKDMNLSRISVDEAMNHMPILDRDKLCGAGYSSQSWDIDTHKLLQDFAKALTKNGRITTRARATKITRLEHGWEVETTAGTFSAKNLVNAAGAWVDEIAIMTGLPPIGITPKRRSAARIPAPEHHDISTWPMTVGAGETWYSKPDAGALLVSPADAEPSTPHDAWADDMVLAEGLARFEDMVTTPVTRLLANWAGLRSFSKDGNLALGRAPQDETFIWCAGQGGFGIQTSPAASKLLADLISGTASEIDQTTVAKLNVARFFA
jgi:D-arginine dehydrogenase